MANVGSKRSRVDSADRREFGQLKKKARKNADVSKALLATERGQLVVAAARRFGEFTEHLSDVRKLRADVTDQLSDMRFVPPAAFDPTRLHQLCRAAREQTKELENVLEGCLLPGLSRGTP